jgi:glucose-1-phosphate thymidylyltransferase
MLKGAETMKGVIAAGGTGSRLSPLTNPLNKHLLPIYDRPMIQHVVLTLVHGGITDIMVLLSGKHPGLFLEMLEDGAKLGCNITYRYSQPSDGPGRTALLAEKWVGEEDFVFILGDSLYVTPLSFTDKVAPHLYVMPLNGFDNPEKYGQVKVSDQRVEAMIWKPKELFSNLIQTTAFIFPPDAFTRLHRLSATLQGEVHISALTAEYINEGNVTYTLLPERSYIDCGSIPALHTAAVLIQNMASRE